MVWSQSESTIHPFMGWGGHSDGHGNSSSARRGRWYSGIPEQSPARDGDEPRQPDGPQGPDADSGLEEQEDPRRRAGHLGEAQAQAIARPTPPMSSGQVFDGSHPGKALGIGSWLEGADKSTPEWRTI